MKTSLTVPIAIVVGGIIVAGAVYLSIQKVPTTDTGNDTPSLLRPVDATDHILGNPAAKVLIVEYSDFDCDFCKTYHETLHQIIADLQASASGDTVPAADVNAAIVAIQEAIDDLKTTDAA